MAEPTLDQLKQDLIAKRDEHQKLFNELWDKNHPTDAFQARLDELGGKRGTLVGALEADASLAEALNPKIKTIDEQIAATQKELDDLQKAETEANERKAVEAELAKTTKAIAQMTEKGQPVAIEDVAPNSTVSLRAR